MFTLVNAPSKYVKLAESYYELFMPGSSSAAIQPIPTDDFTAAAERLVETSRVLYARGWLSATSGNLSAVVNREPLQFAITASGLHKGRLTSDQFILLGADGTVHAGSGSPSAEWRLHVAIVQATDAAAVLHIHSLWSTTLSQVHFRHGGLAISGYEMLKALAGVCSHEHREWLPIVENSQNMPALERTITDALTRNAGVHGILIRGHGLYTWGCDLEEANRHLEALEFLMEVTGTVALAEAGHKS
jgi:methylthioribulose-1-phosphate dehydratase